VIEERDDGAVALVNHARPALVLAEPRDVGSFGPMPLPSGSVVFVAFESV
jgi:hypothetical protein